MSIIWSSLQNISKMTPLYSQTLRLNNVWRRNLSFAGRDVTYERVKNPKPKPGPDNPLAFGTITTDHMFIADWSMKAGWKNPRIVPYQPLNLDPAAKVLHYSMEVFEGLKAFSGTNGDIRLFRPMENMKRFQSSAYRASLPSDFSKTELNNCIKALIKYDSDWIPTRKDCSVYIRPTLIGSDPSLGVNQAKEAILYVILCPVGSYYETGTFEAVRLYADDKAVRAWPGGVGCFKMGSNYGPTVFRQIEAAKTNCVQVLWLYGPEHTITEVGTMNIFAYWINKKGNKEVVTPPLSDIILPGVTRNSILELIKSWNHVPVIEQEFTMGDIQSAVKEKRMLGLFGTGTACVVCPISEISYMGDMISIPTMEMSQDVTHRAYYELCDIQYGRTNLFPEWIDYAT